MHLNTRGSWNWFDWIVLVGREEMKTIIDELTGELIEVEDKNELVAKEMNALITDDLIEQLEQLDYLEYQIKQFKASNKEKIKEIFKKYNIKSFKNDYITISYVDAGLKKQLDTQKLKDDGLYEKYIVMRPYEDQVRITKKGKND